MQVPSGRRSHALQLPVVRDVRVIEQYCRENNVRADGLRGGFPCQGTSSAGQHQGLEDSRTGLATYMFRGLETVLRVVHDHGERLRNPVKITERCYGLSPRSNLNPKPSAL